MEEEDQGEEEEEAVAVVEAEVLRAKSRIHSRIDAMSVAPFAYPGSEGAITKASQCVPQAWKLTFHIVFFRARVREEGWKKRTVILGFYVS